MPDRKEFTNFQIKPSPDAHKVDDAGVSTGVPLSKVRDGIKSISQFKDINTTSALKALDKLVSGVLPNVTAAAGKNSSTNGSQLGDSEGGSGSAMDPKENDQSKTDPYAAIAAGPDHPKLPPDLKISPGGAEGEAPPVVPVGMSDDSKGGDGNKSPDGKHQMFFHLSPRNISFTDRYKYKLPTSPLSSFV